jgi:hypothetical protein
MIKMGLKKNGVKKVQRIFEKYKKEWFHWKLT